MAGGQDFGRRGDFSAIIGRLEQRWSPPLFDQRPGALEATRGLDRAPVAVAANHDIDGWHVQLIAGGVVLARLSVEGALALALDIAETAKIAAGGEWE
ncbi:hypothetical protein [Novosphingobium sp.]|uniref:hypothetical protein n=1 Tax=Novosphingobium sp. TaxID=1874826 RepID=UPI00286EA4F1|nr:hypothetical protein [Novosphingobium sp.]